VEGDDVVEHGGSVGKDRGETEEGGYLEQRHGDGRRDAKG
jgi:hypothetical protein